MTYEKFRALCLSMPESEEVETWGEPTFRVRGRIFAIASPEGKSASVKASLDDQAGLCAMDPKTFSPSAYTGRFGWVRVRLGGLGAEMGARLIRNAWERSAPKRLLLPQPQKARRL
jgi:hypothetical protein